MALGEMVLEQRGVWEEGEGWGVRGLRAFKGAGGAAGNWAEVMGGL